MKQFLISLLLLASLTAQAQNPQSAPLRIYRVGDQLFTADSLGGNLSSFAYSPGYARAYGAFIQVGSSRPYKYYSPAKFRDAANAPYGATVNESVGAFLLAGLPLTGGSGGSGSFSGNANELISGTIPAARYGSTVVQTGNSYPNPAWLTALAATKITGVLAPAQLGTGTPTASKYLDGTGAWSTPPSGGGSATVPSRTGSVIAFDTPAVYNSASSPATGNVSYDLTGALANNEVILYHNSTAPTFPAITTVIGTYWANNLNEIRLVYKSSTEVVAVIKNSNSSGYVNPSVVYQPAADVSTTGTSGVVTGMTIPIEAGAKYVVQGLLSIESSGSTNGYNLGTSWGVTPAVNDLVLLGRAATATTSVTVKTASTLGMNALVTAAVFGGAASASTGHWVTVTGIVQGGASNTTFDMLFAPVTSGVTITVKAANSYLTVRKL